MEQFKALRLVEQSPFVRKFVFVTLSIIAVFVLMLFLPWQQTVHGVGTLTALDPTQRDYHIVATVDGFIEEFYVKENQFVKKGEKLFRMRDLDADYQNRLVSIREKSIQKYENEMVKLKNLQESLKSQQKVFRIGVEIYDKKIAQLENSLMALREREVALKNRNRIEAINYQRSKSLYQDGIESKRDLELKESIYLSTKAEYQKVLADIKNTLHALDIAKKERTKFISEMELKINTIENSILTTKNFANTLKQNIEKESTSLSRYLSRDIVAKSDGYVIRIYQNDKNRLIKKGENVLYFSPVVTQRAIRLKVSDFNMPLIKEGLKTRIIFYGWPALQISGWPKITHGTYGGIIKSIERTSHEKGAYYALIVEDPDDTPWPSSDNLKIGTQASVWVRLSTVSIWYELWRLMVSQPPKMVNPPKEYRQW